MHFWHLNSKKGDKIGSNQYYDDAQSRFYLYPVVGILLNRNYRQCRELNAGIQSLEILLHLLLKGIDSTTGGDVSDNA